MASIKNHLFVICSTYYLNLCQPAYNTPDGCPKEAAMCRKRPDDTVDILGMVYTQQITAAGKYLATLPSV